jgi:hypothetical protein
VVARKISKKVLKLVPNDGRWRPQEGVPFKLNLGCGMRRIEGFLGVDMEKTPVTDFVWDLTKTPWPVDDGVVDEAACEHFFEHLTGPQRVKFMEELYRMLKPGAKTQVVTPYWSSMRAVQDFTHQWPPVCEYSFLYFNKGWREQNLLTHGPYDIKCDFDFGYGYGLDGDFMVKNNELQLYGVKHYNNVANDLIVTLTKR